MIITCSSCNTKYSINKISLGNKGKKVKCSNCGYEWFENAETKRKKVSTDTFKEETKDINLENEIKINKLFTPNKQKKKNYGFLYFFLLIATILFIYLNKENFNFGIKDSFFKLIKKDFLIKENKNSFALVFNQIEKEVSVLNNNKRVIKIFGKISNTSNMDDHKIPRLQATLFNDEGKIITSWFFNAEKDFLKPQESLNFNTSYIHDKQDIADIKIEFYKKD